MEDTDRTADAIEGIYAFEILGQALLQPEQQQDPWAERCREATRAVEAPEYPEARERWFREMLKGGTCDL